MTQPAFPSESTTLLLDGPAGALEVAVDFPEPADARPLLAVVCHPLPTEGGTMHNKVVTMVARALRELGATTVRFNFRGTGGSAGAFDHGKGEREDLRAVVEWARAGHPGHALWLAGFSFGAYVSLSAAAALRPDALISIAPPVAGRGWEFDDIEIPDAKKASNSHVALNSINAPTAPNSRSCARTCRSAPSAKPTVPTSSATPATGR